MTDRPLTPYERFKADAEAATNAQLPVIERGIPMRDGVELAADVYLPSEDARPAPAIVQMTPYDKSGFGFQSEARAYQAAGYAFVVIDVRGRGKSEGEWTWFRNDGPDGHDAVEWVAAQDWCTGRVGTTGISYMGWTQWATAAERPPSLRCMVSTAAAGRWQEEIPYTFGCFQLYFVWWIQITRRRIAERHHKSVLDWAATLQHRPLRDLGNVLDIDTPNWHAAMDHDTLDDYWQAIRYDGRYDTIDVPCLHVGGWLDLEDLLGTFHHYEHMIAASPAAGSQYLVSGPWTHHTTRRPHDRHGGLDFGAAAAIDMDALHLRWFDHWLKADGATPFDSPRVRVFEMGTNEWREGDRWPRSARTLAMEFDGEALRAGDGSRGAVAQGHRSYRYDPLDPVPTGLDVAAYPDVPLDQSLLNLEERDDVLFYTSDVLAEPIVVSGWPHVELMASSDCTDTDFHVKLVDVHPDGKAFRIASGCLRAACRDSLRDPEPLVPGTVYRFDVELHPVQHAFLPGHRVRVIVASSDFPWFALALNQFGKRADQTEPLVATNVVHHGGPSPSRLLLPVE